MGELKTRADVFLLLSAYGCCISALTEKLNPIDGIEAKHEFHRDFLGNTMHLLSS